MFELTDSPVWRDLMAHHREMADVHVRDLFANDPARFDRFSLRLGDILFDYSKNSL